jgi:hypothetical protein
LFTGTWIPNSVPPVGSLAIHALITSLRMATAPQTPAGTRAVDLPPTIAHFYELLLDGSQSAPTACSHQRREGSHPRIDPHARVDRDHNPCMLKCM